MSSSVLDGFNNSKKIKSIGDFELGTFGRNSGNRKLLQKDRFPESELKDTIKNIKNKYRASDNKNSYRYENIANIAKMPNGEIRVIYTRLNENGKNEILNWHKISDKKYLDLLKSFGASERN